MLAVADLAPHMIGLPPKKKAAPREMTEAEYSAMRARIRQREEG